MDDVRGADTRQARVLSAESDSWLVSPATVYRILRPPDAWIGTPSSRPRGYRLRPADRAPRRALLEGAVRDESVQVHEERVKPDADL